MDAIRFLTNYFLVVVVVVVGLYIGARIITAAFFKSKADYERSQQHGTRTTKPPARQPR